MPRYQTESWGAGDMSWLGSTHGIYNCRTVAPDPAMFTAVAYPDGVPSGTPLGLITATGLYGPYTGDSSDEVQTITEGGSGLTSFTLTYAGQTTTSLLAAATSAQVQAALEALSNIAVGDVTVTGDAGGVYTVTFGGNLANTNVAQMTSTPTGGTGTVTVATSTAGGADVGSDGRQILAGFLYTDQKAPAEGGWPMLDHGRVRTSLLPVAGFLPTGHNTSGTFVFIEGSAA
ncbi:MAG TPA: hypothetical protein VK611_26880 [Acidimicrobiales bacterium]|nr:hypothetical protein [Acidimicrobiales bacterium]